jgi:hypothetical protein
MKQGADVAHAIDRRVSSELEYAALRTLLARRALLRAVLAAAFVL